MQLPKSAANKNFAMISHKIVDLGIWAKLSPKAKAVYIVLLRYAGYKNREAFPSVLTIAKAAGLNPKNVSRATAELVIHGLIKKWRVRGCGHYCVYPMPEINQLIQNATDKLTRKGMKMKRATGTKGSYALGIYREGSQGIFHAHGNRDRNREIEIDLDHAVDNRNHWVEEGWVPVS
jgi:DNA-binding transcriptional regulator YhcF (GntR family)